MTGKAWLSLTQGFLKSRTGSEGAAVGRGSKNFSLGKTPFLLYLFRRRDRGKCLTGPPTKRPVTKRPVTKRPVTKRPVTKGPDYQTSRLPNVQLPKVQITKRPVYQTSSYQTSSYRTSILVIITKHPFFILIIFFNKMCQKYQVCIPI
jgi:hypothetical protein